MKWGLLWFDDDPARTLEDKVLRAATHYEQKYGHPPNLCFVHPNSWDGNGKVRKAGRVEIRPGRSVLPHHFWIGVTDGAGTKHSAGKTRPGRSLVSCAAAVQAEVQPLTPDRARQLVMELEEVGNGDD